MRTTRTKTTKVPKMKQIITAAWQGEDKRFSYSLLGLGVDGYVYRYEGREGPWMRLK